MLNCFMKYLVGLLILLVVIGAISNAPSDHTPEERCNGISSKDEPAREPEKLHPQRGKNSS